MPDDKSSTPIVEQTKTKNESTKKGGDSTINKPVSTTLPQNSVQPAQSTSKPVTLDSSQVIKSKPEKKESLLQSLNSWILPIASLVVLVIVSILVLIPSANDTMTTLDDIRNAEDEIKKYENKIDTLKSISISEVNSAIQLATQVIKDDLEVAQLASDVEGLARDNNLETKSVSFSTTTSSTINIPGFVGIISGPFTYTGTFNDLSSFISDLSTDSPTIVAIREVSMSKSLGAGTEEESTWSANFVIDAFTTRKVESVSLADPVSSLIDEELMEEIVNRINE